MPVTKIKTSDLLDRTVQDIDIRAVEPGYTGILDDKLNIISTAGKVANSATSATADATANTIVSRDANSSSNFNNLYVQGVLNAGSLSITNTLYSSFIENLRVSSLTATALFVEEKMAVNHLTAGNIETTGTESRVRLLFQTFTDLPSAVTYEGMIAVIKDEDLMYFASNGSWRALNTTLPDQTGNEGKFLTTDGAIISWGVLTETVTVVEAIAVDDTLLANENKKLVTNEGAGGAIKIVLPPAALGLTFPFAVYENQTLEIYAADGDKIRIDVTETASAVVPVAATGTITCVAVANLLDAETFTLDDGIAPVVFEFDVTGDGVTGGNVAVDVSTLTTDLEVADAVTTAINGSALGITATDNLDGTVSLVNDIVGVAGNTVSAETVVDVGFILTDMTSGVDEVIAKISANTKGSVITLTALTVSEWFATSVVGTWTI